MSIDLINAYFHEQSEKNIDSVEIIAKEEKDQLIDIIKWKLCFIEKWVLDVRVKKEKRTKSDRGYLASYYAWDVFINDYGSRDFISGMKWVIVKCIEKSYFIGNQNIQVAQQCVYTWIRLENDLAKSMYNMIQLKNSERIRRTIAMLVTTQWEKMENWEYVLYANPTHKYLAALSQAGRQDVSKEIGILNEQGIIKYAWKDSHLLVRDMDALLRK